jgi:serine/threonine protein phosphatase PrpC
MTQVYSRSEKGQVREHNEDAVLAQLWRDGDGPYGLRAILVVADGMGGHEKGGWASHTAIRTVRSLLLSDEALTPAELVRTCIVRANDDIRAEMPKDTSRKPPGTTLTIAAVADDKCTIGHVGDSRAYLYRFGDFRQLTRDDTVIREMIESGEMDPDKASESILQGQLTKSVGLKRQIEPQVIELDLEDGDVLLLCSDGLTGMLGDDEIGGIITFAGSVREAGDEVVRTADKAGGHDNISVALYSHGMWMP